MSTLIEARGLGVGHGRRIVAEGIGFSVAAGSVLCLLGGERQLVLIARALAQQTVALVMDQPTTRLDLGNQTLVLRQVRLLAERDGLGVLMTTHHPDHAFLVGDAAAMLHRGRLTGPDRPERLITASLLGEAYGVETVIGAVPTPDRDRRVSAPINGRSVAR
ncbi:ABC transporter ATP-binding protein [Elioraea sp.]|uniref:ABC transporter ATP-binding protein n=1 Tax=Elioraea sp. TaxID=2185103 RepID=UPI0025C136F6|nr:ABC transporter ATP-binding protein [Elioraea sp.]